MTHLALISGSSNPTGEAMYRHEFTDTPGALDLSRENYVPTRNAYPRNEAAVLRHEGQVAVRRLTAERDALLALSLLLLRLAPRRRPTTHLAPDGHTQHTGSWRDCAHGVCVNDREDDAQWCPPPYVPQVVPQRRHNGQRAS